MLLLSVLTVTYVFWFSESEDEVEELEERVPSPDVAPEESAPFYDPASWYMRLTFLARFKLEYLNAQNPELHPGCGRR